MRWTKATITIVSVAGTFVLGALGAALVLALGGQHAAAALPTLPGCLRPARPRRPARLRRRPQPGADQDGHRAALGWTYAIIGWFGTFTGAHDEGTAHLHRAVDHFRQVDNLPGLAWAYLWAARPAARKGGRAQAAELAEKALKLFRQTSTPYGERSALLTLGECPAHLGNYDLARGYARQVLELAAEACDTANLALAWNVLG